MSTDNVPTESSVSSPLKPTTSETVTQIQGNLINYFRLYAGLPGITFVEDDVTWIASQGMPGNMILRSQLCDDGLELRIDATLRQIGQISKAVDWFVFPSCQPADLGPRLAARGLAGGPDGIWTLAEPIGGPGGTWMLLDLATLGRAPVVAANFQVKQVHDDQMLEEWLRISSTGFGHTLHLADQIEEHPFYAYYAAYARHGFGLDAHSLHYIGYLDDEPVTSSTLLLAGGIAGLFDISTPPAFRRQGFGGAISWAMLQEAHTRGYQDAYVWSSNMGKGVYAGVGFVKAEIGMREYQWQKR